MLVYRSSFCAIKDALLASLCLIIVVSMTAAQYENYHFRNFPKEELVPLAAAYGLALDSYAAGNWTESIRYLEQSLRLHRLLKDSARFCTLRCSQTTDYEPSLTGNRDLRLYGRVWTRAVCQRSCRARFPALQLPLPGRLILDQFNRRTPYRYLHFAYARLDDLQGAVPCAYTFLQRNPEDQEMHQLMEKYKEEYDLSGYLIDHEEQPYEASFLKGVKLCGSGDYSGSVGHMEEALRLYLRQYELCQVDCEGIGQLLPDVDFYTIVADVGVDVLRCKHECEGNLKPNVGGYFVEKFVATIYHYLQYAYYKLNDGRSAVACAHSYFLFEPEDQVMKHNLLHYKANSEQWGLESDHFTPRTEALQHYNQTVMLKQLLSFAEKYLQLDVEDFLGPEEAALLAAESPDAEFNGLGDYEESIYANWRQPKGKGDAGESDI
ncbi:hypothetical protein Q5P01_023397 [Channa striata]|uniref:Leprecan-like alpha-helical domain-containing protein n=1 Tax=Channa striata TaxID=64152 RepID=A0AA88J679_CHASR|nr:hypothetical protein Q5P01_023397 [Channa striata]